MHRLVFRPALAFLTFIAVLVALWQVAGRIAAELAPRLEPTLNDLLASRDIRVEGLDGDWQGFNPVLAARRVTFPAGHVESVRAEVDIIESLARGHLVLHRVDLADALVAIEHTERGWWFAGMERGDGFDWRVLEHSDALDARGALMVAGDPDSTVAVRLVAVSEGGEHGIDARVTAPACACELTASWRATETSWRGGHSAEALAVHGELPVPASVLRWPGRGASPVVDVDLDWRRAANDGGGRGEVRVTGIELPGDVQVGLSARARAAYSDGTHRGVVTPIEFTVGETTHRVPDVAFNGDKRSLELSMGGFDAGTVRPLLDQAFAGIDAARGWLEGLDPRGRMLGARLHLDREGVSYTAEVAGVDLEGYRGVPFARNAAGTLVGVEHGLRFDVAGDDLEIGFPTLFSAPWRVKRAHGVLEFWFAGGRLGIRGHGLDVQRGETVATGGFALARPPDPDETTLALLIDADRMSVGQARDFVPYKLPEAVLRWVDQAPRGGWIAEARVAYQGRVKSDSDPVTRRIELAADVLDATVQYHPDWPLASGINGELALFGRRGRFELWEGRTMGARLAAGEVRLYDNGAWLEADLAGAFDAAQGLRFVHQSPLAGHLPFVTDAWTGAGPVTVAGSLVVPLNPARTGRVFDADLAFTLKGVAVEAPEYRLPLEQLEGVVHYRSPRTLQAERVTGLVAGTPMSARVTTEGATEGERVVVHAEGEATPATAWHLTGLPAYPFVTGSFGWQAELALAPQGSSELRITSDLAGTAIGLPSRLGKTADEARPSSVNVQFLDGYQALKFGYGDVEGWLHLAGGTLRGAVGLGAPHPMIATDAGAVVVAGRLGHVNLAELLALSDQVGDSPLSWQLRALEVDDLQVGDTRVDDVTVGGAGGGGDLRLEFASTMLGGTLSRAGDAPLDLHFHHIRLPVAEMPAAEAAAAEAAAAEGAAEEEDEPLLAPGPDPAPPEVLARLPAARVVIDEATIGEESYGRWSFTIEPQTAGVRFTDAEGSMRGVDFAFPEGLSWDAATNVTSGEVTMAMTDLSAVLPQWGFAPSLETEAAKMSARLAWPGSPLNVALVDLHGELDFDANDGRFLDAEGTNALRIFSLLNFGEITKRLTFDFSDVVGKGVSFDTIRARVGFDAGTMRFREPMVVDGTGSKFQIGGSVNLVAESVDSEMILTLPVGRGLPWYAVYVGLANPLLGVGVLVGERVLRKPLEQVSSFRYRITGTLEDPQVEFVSMFGTEVDTAGVDAGD